MIARSTRRPSRASRRLPTRSASSPACSSREAADFEPNIQAHIDADCDLIVTVGFLLDATAAAAEANPDQQFAIVDFDFFDVDAGEDVSFDNVRELTFATDEAAFLAGYVAAAVSETGVIGTYGGINIPTVTIFMDGLSRRSTSTTRTRVRTSSSSAGTPRPRRASSPATSRTSTTARTPPSSCSTRTPTSSCRWPVPSARARSRRSSGWRYPEEVIWVDTDGCVSVRPDACDLFLTSIMKNMDVAVNDVTVAAANGEFEGGLYVGTLENDGVFIAPFHEYEDAVPQDIVDRVDELPEQIISGEITVGG